jgi:hypothetical protein
MLPVSTPPNATFPLHYQVLGLVKLLQRETLGNHRGRIVQ